MTEFDPDVIETMAARLYRSAALTMVVYTVLGAMVGGLSCLAGVIQVAAMGGLAAMALAFLAALIGGVLGLLVGRERGFALRVQAQTALCQVAIERNTAALVARASGQP